jgi:uncharacterized protein (DUF302 family)
MSSEYVISKQLPKTDYETAVARVTELLAEEGFGILTEIDVKSTLKKKIDVDFRRYVILGACNPSLAHRALSAEPMIGAFLPCNVVVMERDGGGSVVAAFRPSVGFQMIENEAVQPIASEVEERIERILDQLN